MKRICTLVAIVLTFLVFSCASTTDFVGSYENKSDPAVVLVLKNDYTYQYFNNGKLYNAGTWDYENKGWLKIAFKSWKDLPPFDLLNWEKECFAIVTYDDGELIFQPDDYTVNFKKSKGY
jgi:hypothetical protein